jgi:hypothetical protein
MARLTLVMLAVVPAVVGMIISTGRKLSKQVQDALPTHPRPEARIMSAS